MSACTNHRRSASRLLDACLNARRDQDIARLRRVLAVRAMAATGMSQRRIAEALGISQPAVSQQLKLAAGLEAVHPQVPLDAASPILKALAAENGYTRLAVRIRCPSAGPSGLRRRPHRASARRDVVVRVHPFPAAPGAGPWPRDRPGRVRRPHAAAR